MYSKNEEKTLIKLARKAISEHLNNPTKAQIQIDQNKLSSKLKQKRATFVTLTINDNLRGCIGHIMPVQPLYKDVIENARAAAFHDPRFYPVQENELDQIKIEISILSIPKELSYQNTHDLLNRLLPGETGVIIKKGYNEATYLPQVWEDLPDKKTFLSTLCQKAGLAPDEWKSGNPEIRTYTVEKFEEEF